MRPSTRKRLKQRTRFFTRARQRKLRIVAPGKKRTRTAIARSALTPKSRGITVWADDFLLNGPHLFEALAVLRHPHVSLKAGPSSFFKSALTASPIGRRMLDAVRVSWTVNEPSREENHG